MQLKNARENYEYFSGKASDLVRQLGFAGLATIWIFKTVQKGGEIAIPPELVGVGAIIIGALALDFLHYVYAAAAWGIFHRKKETTRDVDQDSEFDAPRVINWPHLGLFWLKIIAIGGAYVLLLKFLFKQWV